MTSTNLLTVRQFCQHEPAFTEGSIRWKIFTNRNGFADKCIRRLDGRVYIHTSDFKAWIDEQHQGGSA